MGVLENCFLGIFSASLRMSVIIIFLLCAKYFITSKYTAKCRYYLWLIVILGLLVPINLSESHSIINLPVTQNAIVSENITSDSEVASFKGTVAIEKLDEQPLQSQKNNEMTILLIAAVIWIAGIVIYLSINILRHLTFINTVKRWFCDTEDELLTKCLEKIKEELDIKANIKLQRCKIIQSPMLIGLFKAQILIPMNLFSEDEIRFILKHELTHFKRKDLLYKLIIFITNAIHWFNPIIYIMNKEISYECESSCDEAIMKSEPIHRRKLYGEMILNTMLENVKKKSVLSTCFYGDKKEMKRRLVNIIDTKIKKKGILVFLLLAVIIVGSTFILGVSMDNKINSVTKESADGNKLDEKNEINNDKITPKEIIAPYSLEKAKSNKDVIIKTIKNKTNPNEKNIVFGILNYDSIENFKEKSDSGEKVKLRLIQYVQFNDENKLYVDWIKDIEFDGEVFLYYEYDTSEKIDSNRSNGKYITDDRLLIYDKLNIIETEKNIKLTLSKEDNSSAFDVIKISKDDIRISQESVGNVEPLNKENEVINNMAESVESDFIKKIDDLTSDEEFTQKIDKILDPSFVIPKE